MTIRYSKGFEYFQEWSDMWLLRLNINECKIAFYGKDINYEYKYYLSSTVLEIVYVIYHLGVVFDSELSFVSHCKEKINGVYSMLGVIKRKFIYLSDFYTFNRGGICYTI